MCDQINAAHESRIQSMEATIDQLNQDPDLLDSGLHRNEQ